MEDTATGRRLERRKERRDERSAEGDFRLADELAGRCVQPRCAKKEACRRTARSFICWTGTGTRGLTLEDQI